MQCTLHKCYDFQTPFSGVSRPNGMAACWRSGLNAGHLTRGIWFRIQHGGFKTFISATSLCVKVRCEWNCTCTNNGCRMNACMYENQAVIKLMCQQLQSTNIIIRCSTLTEYVTYELYNTIVVWACNKINWYLFDFIWLYFLILFDLFDHLIDRFTFDYFML